MRRSIILSDNSRFLFSNQYHPLLTVLKIEPLGCLVYRHTTSRDIIAEHENRSLSGATCVYVLLSGLLEEVEFQKHTNFTLCHLVRTCLACVLVIAKCLQAVQGQEIGMAMA